MINYLFDNELNIHNKDDIFSMYLKYQVVCRMVKIKNHRKYISSGLPEEAVVQS